MLASERRELRRIVELLVSLHWKVDKMTANEQALSDAIDGLSTAITTETAAINAAIARGDDSAVTAATARINTMLTSVQNETAALNAGGATGGTGATGATGATAATGS